VTLTAVVALTLAACGNNTTDTREWSDETFRDLMAYCQTEISSGCATFVIQYRDDAKCSVEATYRLWDAAWANDGGAEAFTSLLFDVLIPAGDCLGYVE